MTTKPDIFQYTIPTLEVTTSNGGTYVFDCAYLNAYIRRAILLIGTGIKYQLGKPPDPSDEEINSEDRIDCSGLVWYVTYRKRLSTADDKKYWVQIPYPIPGCATRYDPKPGASYGHSGFVVSVDCPLDGEGNPDYANWTNFATLESTDYKEADRGESILYRTDGKKKWITTAGPNSRFLVSMDAVSSVNSVLCHRPLNVLLSASAKPIETTVAVAGIIALTLASTALMIEIWRLIVHGKD